MLSGIASCTSFIAADQGFAAPVRGYGAACSGALCFLRTEELLAMEDKTRIELEAAVYRRLVDHLRGRTDVQNIDLMNLAGFCRNCLSNWMKDAADEKGVPMSKEQSREIVYGEPYEQWRTKHHKEATAEQKAAFEKAAHKH
jgi:hypothetical protein